MNKKEELKSRVNFSYYEENLTQKEIGSLLNISRQRVNAILNANSNHKLRKSRRIGKKTISRKVQFHKNTGPTVAIPKDMLERIGINEENKDAKIKIDGQNIVIKRKDK